MQESNRICKRVIAEAKLEHWTNFVGTLSDKPDLADAWKKVQDMRAQYKRPNPVLRDGDAEFTNDVDKAEAFADAFKQTSQQGYLPAEVLDERLDYESSHPPPDPEPDESAHFNAPLSMAELERALSGIKKLKVGTGPDRVSYRMMRELPPSYKASLLYIYRQCWDQGRIPAVWKEATVRPIPKKGKPRSSLGSYRPISLTSHVGKVMERMIHRRLTFHLQTLRVIPRCQAGFQKGRSTTDHIAKLGAHVRRAAARRRCLFACFFDVKQAFPTVWHRKLLEKVAKIGLNGKMYNYIRDFLGNRSFRVAWGSALSDPEHCDMGVPQGAVIAPLLFNILLHDVIRVAKGDTEITVYADDIAIWREARQIRRIQVSSGRNPRIRQFMQDFQGAVDRVCKYMVENSLEREKQTPTNDGANIRA